MPNHFAKFFQNDQVIKISKLSKCSCMNTNDTKELKAIYWEHLRKIETLGNIYVYTGFVDIFLFQKLEKVL